MISTIYGLGSICKDVRNKNNSQIDTEQPRFSRADIIICILLSHRNLGIAFVYLSHNLKYSLYLSL